MATLPYPATRLGQPAFAKLFYLSTVLAAAWAARSIFNPFQDLVKVELALTDVQLSLVQGAALSVPAILLSVVCGRLIDTRSRILLLALLNAVTMVGVIGTAFSQSIIGLAGYRALAGIGMLEEAVVLSLAADLFPPEQRGRANVMIILGDYAGPALGFAMAGWLLPVARELSVLPGESVWREVQMLFGMGGLLLSLPLLWVREPPRQECSEAAGMPMREGFRLLWQMRGFLAPLLVAQVAMISVSNVASIWSLPVLYRAFALPVETLGNLAAMITSLSAVIGAIIAGVLVDRMDIRRGGALTIAAIASAVAIPASLFGLSPSVAVASGLLFLLIAANTATALSSNTFSIIAVPNDLRGLWFGVSGLVSMLIGFGLAPTLVAVAGSAIGGRASLAEALSVALLASNVLAFASYLAASRAIRRDSR